MKQIFALFVRSVSSVPGDSCSKKGSLGSRRQQHLRRETQDDQREWRNSAKLGKEGPQQNQGTVFIRVSLPLCFEKEKGAGLDE